MALEELKHEEEKLNKLQERIRESRKAKAKLDQAQIAKQDAEKREKEAKEKLDACKKEQTELGNTENEVTPASKPAERSGRGKKESGRTAEVA